MTITQSLSSPALSSIADGGCSCRVARSFRQCFEGQFTKCVRVRPRACSKYVAAIRGPQRWGVIANQHWPQRHRPASNVPSVHGLFQFCREMDVRRL